MAAQTRNITITFDDGINYVNWIYGGGTSQVLSDGMVLSTKASATSYVVSGTEKTVSYTATGGDAAYDGIEIKLKDGYELSNTTPELLGPYTNVLLRQDFITVYGISGDNVSHLSVITLTTKKTTSRKSIDLTTLSGWSGLTSGAHSIQLKAKAEGYRDSELSQAVSVTKEAESYQVTLISNIEGYAQKTDFRIYDSETFGNNLLYEASGTSTIDTPLSLTCESGYLFIFGDSEISPSSKVESVTGGVSIKYPGGAQTIILEVTGDGTATINYYFRD